MHGNDSNLKLQLQWDWDRQDEWMEEDDEGEIEE